MKGFILKFERNIPLMKTATDRNVLSVIYSG
jgi:hypothetical protein